MLYYLLTALVFGWLSWRWLLQVDPEHRDYVDAPMGFTLIGLPLLIGFAMETSTIFICLLVLVSLSLHANYKHWRPFHSGVAASFVAGAVLLYFGVITGSTPTEWGSTPADAALLFFTTSAVGCGAVRLTTSTGYLPRYFAVLSGLYERRGQTSSNKYGYRRSDDSRLGRFLHWMGFRGYTTAYKHSFGGDSNEPEQTDAQQKQPDRVDSEASLSDLEASVEDHPSQEAERAEQESETQSTPTQEWSVTPVDQRGDGDEQDEEEQEENAVEDSDNNSESEADADSITEYQFPWEEPPEMRFENIGGYTEVKDALREQVVSPLQGSNPSYDRFGIEPSRGLLFHGPPGTGKTLFARALANELNRPFVELTQADLTHEFINKSPQIIQRLFKEAQELGGVVFIDEAEQLLGSRDDSLNSHAEDKKITNMFLSALTKEDKDYIILLTTNLKDSMDDAILRPGRIDEDFKIDLPDRSTRLEIIKIMLADVPHRITQEQAEVIASKTDGWSGADLNALINQAKFKAVDRQAKRLKLEDIRAGYNEIAGDKE